MQPVRAKNPLVATHATAATTQSARRQRHAAPQHTLQSTVAAPGACIGLGARIHLNQSTKMTTQEKPRLPEKKSCDPLLSVVGDRRSSRRRLARSVLQLINIKRPQCDERTRYSGHMVLPRRPQVLTRNHVFGSSMNWLGARNLRVVVSDTGPNILPRDTGAARLAPRHAI